MMAGTYVQLGWISDAVNVIFDRLLNPMFSWMTKLLSDAFSWLFNNILGPLLESAFSIIMQTVGKYLMRIIGRILYHIEEGFLLILDMFQHVFNVLAGTQPVTDNNTGAAGSLLTVLIRTPFVTKTMLVIITISFVLCFFFAVLGTIKSIGDMGGPQSRTVGQVLRKLFVAILRMVSAPLIGLILVLLGDAVLQSITNAMTLGENVTIAQSLFVISSLDAVDDEFGAVDKYGVEHKGGQRITFSWGSSSASFGDMDNMILGYNYSTRPEYLSRHQGEASDFGLRDMFREPFYTGEKSYSSSVDVDDTFNVGRLDYLIGIGGSILFIWILGTAMFTLVSRIFDVIILLLVEPFFIAPMPLDDGEQFQKWQDMFIAKLFSGYGMVVAMYIYLLICSMVFDGQITFTPRSDIGDIMTDMMMRILLLIGGAATVMTAGPLVTSILNHSAGEQEAQAVAAGTAFSSQMIDLGTKPVQFGAKMGMNAAVDSIVRDMKGSSAEEGSSGNLFSGSKGKGGGMKLPGIAEPGGGAAGAAGLLAGKTGAAGGGNRFSGKK